jgi:hypothetical protein
MEEYDCTATFDQLLKISDRLYCVMQAMRFGDDSFTDHNKKIGSEICEIWKMIENINDNERLREDYLDVKMNQFKTGFAYGRKGISENGSES